MQKLHRDVKWCWPQVWTSFVHRPVLRACPWAHLMLQRASEGTWRPLWPSWSPFRCVLGALGGLLEACSDVQEALGPPLGHVGVVLDVSWSLFEPLWRQLRRSCSRLGGVIGALGAIREASWVLLEPFRRRLGRSWSHPGGVLGALGRAPVWDASWALRAAFCRYAEFHGFLDVFR